MSKPIKRGSKYRIQWTDENGRRQSETWTSHKSALSALRQHQIEVEEIRNGVRTRPPKKYKFDELAKKWMETRGSQKKKPKDDESILRVHLMPVFGQEYLGDIRAEKIDTFTADLLSKRTPQTVRNILTLLGAMMRQAQAWEWITTVPRIRKPKTHTHNKQYKWLRSQEEINRFLGAAKGHRWDMVYPMYATAIYTGMRAGELAGLQWNCVNLDLRFRLITVQKSFRTTTKNSRMRRVPIADPLLPILQQWKTDSEISDPRDLVFPNHVGEMWVQSGRIFQEALAEVLEAARLPIGYITFHSLRHTFASHWVMNGGNLYKLQNILGHSESKTTQIYAHLEPQSFEQDWGIFGNTKNNSDVSDMSEHRKRVGTADAKEQIFEE